MRARKATSLFKHDLLGDPPDGYKDVLARVFTIPPFSVLRASSERWQKRRWWWDAFLDPDASESKRQRAARFLLGPRPLPVRAAGVRVVLAVDADVLTSGEKLIWLMHRHLSEFSKGEDAGVVTAEEIGQHLGFKPRHVENVRGILKAAGLLVSHPRPKQKGETWWATLPSECQVPDDAEDVEAEIARRAAVLGDKVGAAKKAAPQDGDNEV